LKVRVKLKEFPKKGKESGPRLMRREQYGFFPTAREEEDEGAHQGGERLNEGIGKRNAPTGQLIKKPETDIGTR